MLRTAAAGPVAGKGDLHATRSQLSGADTTSSTYREQGDHVRWVSWPGQAAAQPGCEGQKGPGVGKGTASSISPAMQPGLVQGQNAVASPLHRKSRSLRASGRELSLLPRAGAPHHVRAAWRHSICFAGAFYRTFGHRKAMEHLLDQHLPRCASFPENPGGSRCHAVFLGDKMLCIRVGILAQRPPQADVPPTHPSPGHNPARSALPVSWLQLTRLLGWLHNCRQKLPLWITPTTYRGSCPRPQPAPGTCSHHGAALPTEMLTLLAVLGVWRMKSHSEILLLVPC